MPSGRPIHILLTKADKLSRQEGTDALRKVRQEIEKRSPLFSAQLFSSSKKVGVEEAEKVFSAWLGLTDPRPADDSTNKKAPD